ncbi:unnamed protein product [Lepeophtheirus salmonis]|uniref:(salmon louse) hypothetical protein n=1 Tax=Lepeophtheirus salmonis TaxID=72036 RepID=A0A7R8CM53_LEPSM|nr:unnamed protein product [Lepeophtheirus salmonis]CAF2863275.1 unnamed protein product [Lepeophtheirus salmonis]
MSSLSPHPLLHPAPKGFACPDDFCGINSIPLPRNGPLQGHGCCYCRDLFSLFGKPPVILDVLASVDSPVLLVGEDDASSVALQVIEETLTVHQLLAHSTVLGQPGQWSPQRSLDGLPEAFKEEGSANSVISHVVGLVADLPLNLLDIEDPVHRGLGVVKEACR